MPNIPFQSQSLWKKTLCWSAVFAVSTAGLMVGFSRAEESFSAIDYMQGPEFAQKIEFYQGLGVNSKAVKMSDLQWPFPSSVSVVKVSSADLDRLEKVSGFSVKQLSNLISQMGQVTVDLNALKEVIEWVELRKVSDTQLHFTLHLKALHCPLDEMDLMHCEKSVVLIPGRNIAQFNALVRARDLHMNYPTTPELVHMASDIDPTSKRPSQWLTEFKAPGTAFELQTMELATDLTMDIGFRADADGDAVVEIKNFHGILAHFQIPSSSSYVQSEGMSGLLDRLSRVVMNGTVDFFPRWVKIDKTDFATSVGGAKGAITVSYSMKNGVTVMGIDQNSAIGKYFAQRFSNYAR